MPDMSATTKADGRTLPWRFLGRAVRPLRAGRQPRLRGGLMLDAAVTFRDGIGVDDLTWLAGLITVISVIVGAVWAMLKPLKRQADRIEAFWVDWNGTPAGPGRSAVPGVMERLQSIDGELTHNGGNSLKDQVRTNSRKLDDLAEQNSAEHVDLANQILAVKTEAQHWHTSKEKP